VNLSLVVSDDLKTDFWLRGMRGNLQQELRESLAVQRLELSDFTTEGKGSIPGQGTRVPKAMQPKTKRSQVYWEALLFQTFITQESTVSRCF
jgi:hypothetical protein